MSWAIEAFKKYAVFRGRSRRKEYWYFVLFTLIISAVLSLVDSIIGTSGSSAGTGLLGGIFSLAILIPSIAVSVRRLHDIGHTGWWVLIGLIPVIGAIVLIVFAVMDSEAGTNQYGANPKTALA